MSNSNDTHEISTLSTISRPPPDQPYDTAQTELPVAFNVLPVAFNVENQAAISTQPPSMSCDRLWRKPANRIGSVKIMKAQFDRWYVFTCGAASVLAIAGAGSLLFTRPAAATAQFAAETKLSCGACHTNPQGAGPLTAMGEKFKANGNKMPD